MIKHRNDLKLKMEKIKEDMENGLIDDKEKLKHLALIGSRVYKVSKAILRFLNFLKIIYFKASSSSLEARQNNNSVNSPLREYGTKSSLSKRD